MSNNLKFVLIVLFLALVCPGLLAAIGKGLLAALASGLVIVCVFGLLSVLSKYFDPTTTEDTPGHYNW